MLSAAALCLALNVYWESRGEPVVGQFAVAHVTMNRAGRDHDRVCTEVFRPGQFSWANSLTARKGAERARLAARFVPKSDDKAWQLAKTVASYTLDGAVHDVTKGAEFYHADYVRPSWSRVFKLTAVIGRHRFYKFA